MTSRDLEKELAVREQAEAIGYRRGYIEGRNLFLDAVGALRELAYGPEAAVDESCKFAELLVSKVKLEHVRQFLQSPAAKAGERVRAMEAVYHALRGLLLSADCAWEERNEGHDWAEACQKARAALQAYEEVDTDA